MGDFNSIKTVTIPAGNSLSGSFNTGGLRIVGIRIPASWTAANLTFQHSPDDDTNFKNVYDSSGNELVYSVPAANTEIRDLPELQGSGWLKIRSGTAAAIVNQAAARTIEILLAP